jgi:DNA-binding response OmpR family regulator
MDLKLNLLIVDQINDELNEIKAHFDPERFNVYCASDGNEAFEIAKKIKPQIIISNTQLPKMDGWDLCKAIKSDTALNYIIFIFLTSEGTFQQRIKGFDLGADDYITRPYKKDDLLARIEICLKKKRELHKTPLEGKKVISGNLGHLGLADIFQMLGMNKRTCTVTLEKPDKLGKIFFEKGKVLHAFLGDVQGETAVHNLLQWTDADFFIEDGISGIFDITIGKDAQSLLIDGLAKSDEERKNVFQENVLQKLFDTEAKPIANLDLKKALERLEEMGLIERVK